MKLSEAVELAGLLEIYKVIDGNKKLIFKDENLITLSAKQVIITFLYSVGITSDPITRLWVGTGGTIDPQGLFPKLEDPTQTNLITPLISVATTHTEDLAIPAVTFIADLDTGTANGNLISEAGLFKTSGLIFNIKNFPAVPKSSDFGLHFSWTIKFN